ncbi:hypothetical protein BH11PSE1_BH11PSE1_11300 [soil metagenome]
MPVTQTRTWSGALAVGLVLLCAGAARSQPGADEVPSPGYWETTNASTFVFTSRSVERKCFTASDVSKVLAGPSNRHYACTYSTRVVGEGRILLKGRCVTKHGQIADIVARGVYAPTQFHLSATLTTRIAGLPLSGAASTEARRISDTCPTP